MNLNKTLNIAESSRKVKGPSAPPLPINIVRDTLSDVISGTKHEEGGGEYTNVLKCEVRKKICIVHNRAATRIKVYKEAWTKSKKTGLYYMSKRNV